MEKYKIILEKGGRVHLKTDNDQLYAYTAEVLKEFQATLLASTEDLYQSDLVNEVLQIKTFYEKKYLAVGKNINYLSWKM